MGFLFVVNTVSTNIYPRALGCPMAGNAWIKPNENKKQLTSSFTDKGDFISNTLTSLLPTWLCRYILPWMRAHGTGPCVTRISVVPRRLRNSARCSRWIGNQGTADNYKIQSWVYAGDKSSEIMETFCISEVQFLGYVLYQILQWLRNPRFWFYVNHHLEWDCKEWGQTSLPPRAPWLVRQALKDQGPRGCRSRHWGRTELPGLALLTRQPLGAVGLNLHSGLSSTVAPLSGLRAMM